MATLMSVLKQAGFKGDGLRMAYAIAMAESGGRATAYNGKGLDRSYGLFQINMLGAMGPERRSRYGLSSNEALYDPLTNAKVAFKMSGGGKHWGPWSTYTNGAYKQYYGGSMGAGISGGGGGSAYNIEAVTPKLDKYELAERYGLTWRTISANSELKSLFSKAVKGQWDATLFTAKLKNTKWWRTTSDTQRKYFLLRTGDPATYKQKWQQNQFAINKLAVDVGLLSQIDKKGMPSALLRRAMTYKMRDGWSDARLKAWMGAQANLHDGEMYGEAGEIFDELHQMAYLNGQQFTNTIYRSKVRNILAGKSTLEAERAHITSLAAGKYSSFAEQIRAGQSAMDLAQPYISAVAQILELPSTDVDLSNRYVREAMTTKAKPGQMAGAQYPLWQFENKLRSDPLWKQTNNARESMFSVAHQVAKDFGLTF